MRRLTVLALVVGCLAPGTGAEELSERFGLVHGDPEFLAELGSGWNRHDFTWAGIEREKDVFDFGEFPARVERSLALGVNLLPILDYNPAWDPDVSPADEETLDYWARYVERTVGQFVGQLRYWQVWNEPNYGFWKPESNPRDYAELLRRSYLAVKKANPDAQVIGVNCSGIDLDFTEQVFRYGGLQYCDVLAYQPYRIAPEVGHFEEMAALRRLIARFGEEPPIWFTEVGWGSEHFPFNDAQDLLAERPMRRQAAFLVRYMVIIQAIGVEKVFWFAQSAGGAGLEDYQRKTKRLSFYACQHLIETLDAYTAVREVWPHGVDGLYAYLFTLPDRAVVVAWSANGPRTLSLKGLVEAVEVRDMLGEPLPALGGDEASVSGEPIYLVFEETPSVLRARASLTIEPTRCWLEPGASASIGVKNAGTEPQRVHVDAGKGLRVRPGVMELGPDEEKTFTVSVSATTRPQRGTVTLRAGDTEWPVEVNVAPRRFWVYEGESEKYTQPTVLHRKNGKVALVTAALATPEIVCLSATGDVVWRYMAGAPVYDAVTVADVTCDGEPEIIAAMPNKNVVFMLSADGVLQWRGTIPGDPPQESPSWRWTRPVVCEGQIVYADSSGHVNAFGPDGAALWRTKVGEVRCDRPMCVADLTGTDDAEILVGDDAGVLHCLSGSGEIVWQTDTGAAITSAPAVGAVGPDGDVRVFVGNLDENLVCASSAGTVLWRTPLGGTMDLGTGIVVTGESVYVSTRNHQVVAFSPGGDVLWRVEAGAQFRTTPALGDVDGDGEYELVIGSADWRVYCIGLDGQVEWTIDVGNRVDTSLLLADVNGDGVDDIVQPVRGGKVVAYTLARRSLAERKKQRRWGVGLDVGLTF